MIVIPGLFNSPHSDTTSEMRFIAWAIYYLFIQHNNLSLKEVRKKKNTV